MAVTRPVGEQLAFHSEKTGVHVLDDYLEAVEAGNRTLADLVGELFDFTTGELQFVEFRLNANVIEYRIGSQPWTPIQDYSTFYNDIQQAKTDAEAAATNAATSETNAASSESSALTHRDDAQSARDAAQTAEANAAATYDSFDDRYLGVKASTPTTDNDGAALIAGALYFDSGLEEMQVWTGAVWQRVTYVSGVSSVNGQTGDVTTPVQADLDALEATAFFFGATL